MAGGQDSVLKKTLDSLKAEISEIHLKISEAQRSRTALLPADPREEVGTGYNKLTTVLCSLHETKNELNAKQWKLVRKCVLVDGDHLHTS